MLQRFPVESKGRRKKLQEVIGLHVYHPCAHVFLAVFWFLIGTDASTSCIGRLCNCYMLLVFSAEMYNGKNVFCSFM